MSTRNTRLAVGNSGFDVRLAGGVAWMVGILLGGCEHCHRILKHIARSTSNFVREEQRC